MNFKLPTFSAVVFGVIGFLFSFFLTLQIKTIEMMFKLNGLELTLHSLDKSILFFSNPFVGVLIGVLVGFLVGLILEWLFSERNPIDNKVKIWKKWWFWVIIAILILVFLVYSYLNSRVYAI